MSKKKTLILPGPSKFPMKKPAKAPTLSLAEKTIKDLEWLKETLGINYKQIFLALFGDGGRTLLEFFSGVELTSPEGQGSNRKSYSLTHETVQTMDRVAKELGVTRSRLVDISIQAYAYTVDIAKKKEEKAIEEMIPQVKAFKKAFEELDVTFWREKSDSFGLMEEYIYQFFRELENKNAL